MPCVSVRFRIASYVFNIFIICTYSHVLVAYGRPELMYFLSILDYVSFFCFHILMIRFDLLRDFLNCSIQLCKQKKAMQKHSSSYCILCFVFDCCFPAETYFTFILEKNCNSMKICFRIETSPNFPKSSIGVSTTTHLAKAFRFTCSFTSSFF